MSYRNGRANLPAAGERLIFGVHYMAEADTRCPAWPSLGTAFPKSRPAAYAAHLRWIAKNGSPTYWQAGRVPGTGRPE